VPLVTLTGVEGKTFVPMALTVIIALACAFVLSLTFVPASIALWLSKRVEEKDGRIISWLKRRYEPGLDAAMKQPTLTIGAGVGRRVERAVLRPDLIDRGPALDRVVVSATIATSLD